MAEKEPEDIAVVLPSSKRHCTTFNSAVYPKTYQRRDLSLQMMMSSCTFQWGRREQMHLL